MKPSTASGKIWTVETEVNIDAHNFLLLNAGETRVVNAPLLVLRRGDRQTTHITDGSVTLTGPLEWSKGARKDYVETSARALKVVNRHEIENEHRHKMESSRYAYLFFVVPIIFVCLIAKLFSIEDNYSVTFTMVLVSGLLVIFGGMSWLIYTTTRRSRPALVLTTISAAPAETVSI